MTAPSRHHTCLNACSSNTPRLDDASLAESLKSLPNWRLDDDKNKITRKFVAKNFMAAITFFNKVAEVAEGKGHHPDLHLVNYREVQVDISTHAIGGLAQPDIDLAKELDALDVEYSPKWLKQQAEAAQE